MYNISKQYYIKSMLWYHLYMEKNIKNFYKRVSFMNHLQHIDDNPKNSEL